MSVNLPNTESQFKTVVKKSMYYIMLHVWLLTGHMLTSSWELEIVCHFHEEEIAEESHRSCVLLPENGLLGNLGSCH